MTRKQALSIVHEGLKMPLSRLAFGANLYKMGIDEPWTRRDYEKRREIQKALVVLEKPELQMRLFE